MRVEEFHAADFANLVAPSTRPDFDPEPSKGQGHTVFGIRTGRFGLLVPATLYCEVLDKIPINRLPNVHAWLSGLLNLRGNLVPVFDLRIALGEVPCDSRKRRLFAIGRGDRAAALWIDDLPEIKDRASIGLLQELPALPPILKGCVTHGYEQAGQVWLNLDFADLFRALGRH